MYSYYSRHDITEILLKVALNSIHLTYSYYGIYTCLPLQLYNDVRCYPIQ